MREMTSDHRLEEPIMEDKSEPDPDSAMDEEITGDGEELEGDCFSADSSSTLGSSPAPTVLNTENEDNTPQDDDEEKEQDSDSDSEDDSDGLLPARYDARKKGKVG